MRRGRRFEGRACAAALGFSCLLGASTFPQGEPVGEVDLPRGSSGPVVVSPSCDLWIGALHGHLWVSRDGGDSWVEVDTPARKGKPRSGSGGEDLGLVRFFDRDTGILPLSEGVLRTSDGGKTWRSDPKPVASRLSDVQVASGGRGWIVGWTSGLLHTRDGGLTWTRIAAPFEHSVRVHFASDEVGAVADASNGLALTRDGGRSWDYLATPADQLQVEVHTGIDVGGIIFMDEGYDPDRSVDTRIDRLRLSGDWIVVQQDVTHDGGEVFWRSAASASEWERATVGEDAVVDFEVHPEGLVVITGDRRLVLLDDSMNVSRVLASELSVVPATGFSGGLSVGCERVYVFDGRERILVVEEGRAREMRLRTRGEHARWNVRAVDRAADGRLWGITEHALHSSMDGGHTWERIAALPGYLSGVLLQGDGDLFLWNGWEQATRWRQAERDFVPVPGFSGVWLKGILRRGSLWLAYGSRVHDEEKARFEWSVDHSSWVGEWLTGVVLASADGGVTWTVLHEAPGERVEDVFLGEDDQLATVLAADGFQRGPLSWERGALRWSPAVTTRGPFEVDYAIRVLFLGPERGWLQAGVWFAGPKRWYTEDGGRTWEGGKEVGPVDEYLRLGDGSLLVLQREYTFEDLESKETASLSVWRDGEFHRIREFAEGVHRCLVDAGGGLLVDLPSGELWRLAPDGRGWQLLHP